jgi:SSS family solute:Na+ symporter
VIIQQLPGGLGQILAYADKHDKLRVFDFSFSLTANYTFLAGTLGGMFLTMGSHGADQMMVQRYLSARSERDARRALISSGVVVFLQFALFLALGLGLATFYSVHPPRQAFSKPDQAFAAFIVNYLPVGALGITLAAVFAAALSTSLNSLAAAAVNDFYLAWTKSKPSEAKLLWLSRVLTVIFGVVQIGVGIAAQGFSETVVNEVLAIASFATGILLGVFFLGIVTQHVTQPAALFGLVVGLICMLIVKSQTALAYTYFAVLGATFTFLLGLWFQWLMDLAKNNPDQPASDAGN